MAATLCPKQPLHPRVQLSREAGAIRGSVQTQLPPPRAEPGGGRWAGTGECADASPGPNPPAPRPGAHARPRPPTRPPRAPRAEEAPPSEPRLLPASPPGAPRPEPRPQLPGRRRGPRGATLRPAGPGSRSRGKRDGGSGGGAGSGGTSRPGGRSAEAPRPGHLEGTRAPCGEGPAAGGAGGRSWCPGGDGVDLVVTRGLQLLLLLVCSLSVWITVHPPALPG